MLEGLDSVPWQRLTHAYGSAEDVPDMLRALAADPSPLHADDAFDAGDESPLESLFGSICHQGSVYEATAHAVPFLLELVAESSTPDRIEILYLLSEIAKGTSHRAAQTDAVHAAVARGLDVLLALTKEQGDVRLAAAHVLALLPAQAPDLAASVESLLHELLGAERESLGRAGLLLLLGLAGGRSKATLALLAGALASGDDLQRDAAAISLVRLQVKPLASAAREAILDAARKADLEVRFHGLPWNVQSEIDRDALYASIEPEECDGLAERCIAAIELDRVQPDTVDTLMDLLFPFGSPPLRAAQLSPLQARAVRAMAGAMEGGRRIFDGLFMQWGLPDSMREWRALAGGQDAPAIDMTLPMLADPSDPRRAIQAGDLKIGQRVLHRAFGVGSVVDAQRHGSATQLKVQFDDEGLTTLLL